jgi:hypothetical protein
VEDLLQVFWVFGFFYYWFLAEWVIRRWEILFSGFCCDSVFFVGVGIRGREIDFGVDVFVIGGGGEMALNGVVEIERI